MTYLCVIEYIAQNGIHVLATPKLRQANTSPGQATFFDFRTLQTLRNILTDENEILSQWREYFEDLLNSVKVSTRDTLEVTHLREDEVFTATEVATAI